MTINRETLYDEVWREPMTTVAKRYNVSSNYLARVCEQYKVPRPGRGYWQQLTAGKEVERDPLPEPDPGDELAWNRGDDNGYYRRRSIPTPVFAGLGERKTRREERPKTHPLVSGVRDSFLDSKPRRFDRHGYLVPKRGALPDIFSSKDALNAALDFANRLYLALEDRGHWVREAPVHEYDRPKLDHEEAGAGKAIRHSARHDSSRIWSSARPTLVYIGGVAIGMVVFELAEEVEVTYSDGTYVRVPQNKMTDRLRAASPYSFSHHFLPSGRLGLQVYSPYHGARWEQYWRESKAGDLKKMLDAICDEFEARAPKLAAEAQESARKAEEEHQRYLVAERERRGKQLAEMRVQAAAASRDQLLGIIDGWVTARHVQKFFADLAEERGKLGGEEQAAAAERVARAMKLFGGADAMGHFGNWRTPEEHLEEVKSKAYWRDDDL